MQRIPENTTEVKENLSQVTKKKRKRYDQKGYCRIRPQYLHFESEEGASGFTLSKAVTQIPVSCFTASAGASPEVQSRVLRVLCDRYPNVFASMRDHAEKANLSIRSARRGLRALERIGMITRVEVIGDYGSPRQYRINARKVLEASSPKMLRSDSLSGVYGQPDRGVRTASPEYPDTVAVHSGLPGRQTNNAEEKERDKETITSTTTAPPTPRGGNDNDDVIDPFELIKAPGGAAAAGPVELPARRKATAKKTKAGTPVDELDSGQFIADITSKLSGLWGDCKSTSAHREEAVELVRRHGSDVVLGAAGLWHLELIRDRTSIIVGEKDGNPVYKSWLLREFVRSGAAARLIAQAKPYAGLRDSALRFAIDNIIRPAVLTTDRKDALNWLLNELDLDSFEKAYNAAGLSDITSTEEEERFVSFLINIESHYDLQFRQSVLDWAKQRGTNSALETAKSMIKTNEKGGLEGYEPIRQRLIAEQGERLLSPVEHSGTAVTAPPAVAKLALVAA